MKNLFVIISIIFFAFNSEAQCNIDSLGQNPSTAFPVCGVDTFKQNTVPGCAGGIINTFCNDGITYQALNPYWYRFTCFKSGTLGFLIVPTDSTDDYDWVLFDITNHNPSEVFNGTSLIVTYNWSGNTSTESARGYTGTTGASPKGSLDFVCATNPKELGNPPPYYDASTLNKMPGIIQGHTYLLMVSHFTSTNQSGYKLSFEGGTAVITDPGIPAIKSAKIECDHQAIAIKLTKQVRCNTLASDGSDFSLSSGPASIISATGVNCKNGFDTDSVLLNLNGPLLPGNYSINAQIGADGNTLLDDCNNSVVVGDNAPFVALPIIYAQFTYQVFLGCKMDSIQFFDNGKNSNVQWQWTFDSVSKSALQNPKEIYSIFGNKTVQLIVSNGACSDTTQTTIVLDNTLNAGFTANDHVCPEDKVSFTNTSIGDIISWLWDFGDGTISSDSMPDPHSFPSTINEVTYNVRLIVENASGCYDTSTRQITKVRSCYIDVPSAFTPNGDSHNDYLYPLNAYKAINLEFRVYNRYGQLVFETKDWTKKWDGTIAGKPQPTGTYVWMLEYINRDTGKKYAFKGTTVLIR